MSALFSRVAVAAAAACSVSVFSTAASAQAVPAYTVNPSFTKTVDADPNAYDSLGFQFTTTQDLLVTALGYNANEEFAGTRDVSITTVGGTELVSADVVVPTGGTQNNAFVYTDLPVDYALPAGTYRITAPIPTGMGYHFSSDPADETEAPGITYDAGVVNGGTTGARFYNVNFQVVPEPATAALLSLGGLMLLARRRRA